MIGSEGTLGFISRVTYHTVPDYAHKASALAFFPDMESACRAVVGLKERPVDAVELLDRASLRSRRPQAGHAAAAEDPARGRHRPADRNPRPVGQRSAGAD
jgi:D-lactate dehydrogenase